MKASNKTRHRGSMPRGLYTTLAAAAQLSFACGWTGGDTARVNSTEAELRACLDACSGQDADSCVRANCEELLSRAHGGTYGDMDCAEFAVLCSNICEEDPASATLCSRLCNVLVAQCEAVAEPPPDGPDATEPGEDTPGGDPPNDPGNGQGCDIDVTWRNICSTTWTADFVIEPASGTVQEVTWEILEGPTAGSWPMRLVNDNNQWQGEAGAHTTAGTDVRLVAVLAGGVSISTEVFDFLNNDAPQTAGCTGELPCVPDTDAELCRRWGANCGQVVGTDNCNATRTVTSCGTCTAPATCGGAGQPNRCGEPGGSGLFLDGFFPIGVFGTPPGEFSKWIGRGVNTLVGVPAGTTDTAFDQAARDAGLKQIRAPLEGNPQADIGNPSLLAWFQPDEPDAYGAPLENREQAQANYASWKAADPSIPVLVNFGGSDVLSSSPYSCNGPGDGGDESCYPLFIDAADWISNDIYPLTGYLSDNSTRGQITLVGDVLDKLSGWTDKPQFNAIETCNQRFSSNATRGPTRHEVRAEIWNGIIHGSRGYYFFSIAFNPFQWDNTPTDVAQEITAQNATVTQLGSVLQSAINPPGLSAVVPAPLEAGWREAPSGKYFFVLNTSGSQVNSVRIQLGGVGGATSATVFNESRSAAVSGGEIVDDFSPFEVHIYVIP